MGDELRTRDAGRVFLRKTDAPVTFTLVRSKYHVLEIEDLHFDFDSAVLLPDVKNRPPDDGSQPQPRITSLAILAKCLTHARDNGGQKLLICGHTDTVGPPAYNVGLGEKRADSALFVLTGDRAGWVRIAHGQNKPEDIDVILGWVARDWGWDCDPKTQSKPNAIKGFQREYNAEFHPTPAIAVDGVVGDQTWGAIFDVYQLEIKEILDVDDAGLATLRRGLKWVDGGKKDVGCGESFPVEAMERDEYKSEENRRIELLFFDDGDEPTLKCHPGRGNCKPKQCEVYNPLAYEPDFIPVDPILPRKVRVRVRLKLVWTDPEGTEHPFPKDIRLKLTYGDGSTEERVVEEEGKLQLLADKRKSTLTLGYESGEKRYIASAAPPADGAAPPENPERWVLEGEIAALRDQGFRVWFPAKKWSLAETIWTVGAATWTDPNFDISTVAEIGTRETPEKMVLDPKWQYLRLEFFDRQFGQASHANKRVSIPPVLLDGFKTAPVGAAAPDTRSSWSKNDADPATASCALPWMIQRKADRSADAQPKVGFIVQLITEAGTFVESESATVRKVVKIADAARLAPGPDRLKLYDLPAKWLSRKYFTRFQGGAAGKFFNNLTQQEITDSLQHDKRLTFSLDDIVLTNSGKTQMALAANDRPLVFFHSFDSVAPGASDFTLSTEGVYKPGATATASPAEPYYPYSNLPLPVRYYIDDYPDWVRLVIARGNIHDVFADRTPDVAANEVVGARAGVLWVDSVAGGVAPGTNLNPRPTRTDQPFFSIQPFYDQEYDARYTTRTAGVYREDTAPFPYAGSTGAGIGRFDMALLRCCGVDGDNEQAILLHYFRINLDFSTAPATVGTPPVAFNQATYRKNWLDNVPRRWNSGDGTNNDVPWLIPQDNTKKLKTKTFWIAQEAPRPRAHFHVPVIAGQRVSWMASNGTGNAGLTDDQPDGTGSFVAAHECGHAGSLPDEYNERWANSACSYDHMSFFSRTPGDPYSIIPPGDLMFEGTTTVRPRYYWHDAEFVAAATTWPHQVEHGAMKYRQRQHSLRPKRTYVWWPLVWEVQATGVGTGTRGAFDVMLYDLGITNDGANPMADHFRDNVVAGHTFDGLIVVQVNLKMAFPAAVVRTDIRTPLTRMRMGINANLNFKFQAAGDIGTGAGKRTFANALIHFSPRYLVQHTTADDTPYHIAMGITPPPPPWPPGPPPPWPPTAPFPNAAARQTYFTTNVRPQYATLVTNVESSLTRHHLVTCDNTGATSWTSNQNLHYRLPADAITDFWHWFGDMCGLGTSPAGAPTLAAIQNTVVRRIMPNATVTNV